MLREDKLEGKRDRIEERVSFKNSRQIRNTLSYQNRNPESLEFLFSLLDNATRIDDGLSISKTYSRNSRVTSIVTKGRLEHIFDEVYF